MKKLKLAIIGATGSAYKRTIPALVNSEVCEVVAIQGRNFEKLKKIQSEFNIQGIYTDVNEMLSKESYDFIYIGTPPFLHLSNIEASIATSKPIICEKPLAIDFEEGAKINHLLGKYDDKTFMIAHHLRHQQAIQDIKKFIQEDLIGEILNVSIQWGFEMNLQAPNAIWKTNPNLGGKGTFSDNGIHVVDLAIFLFGVPNSIYGKVEKIRTKETFDNETAFLNYGNNVIQLQSSQSMKFPGNHIFIYGTKGRIEVYNGIGEKSIGKVSIKSPDKDAVIDYPSTNLYGNEVENFCKGLMDKKFQNFGTTLSEGLNALKIIDYVRDSAMTNSILNFNHD
jgi:predicted dehydrogenase